MEIFTILESLEDLIENSRNLPFSSKGIVDKDELLDLIKEVRIKLPDELKQAKWVKRRKTKDSSRSTKRSRWNSKRS